MRDATLCPCSRGLLVCALTVRGFSYFCCYDLVIEIIARTSDFGEGELVKGSPEIEDLFWDVPWGLLTWLGGNRSRSCNLGFISPENLICNQRAPIAEIAACVAGDFTQN